MPQTGRIKTPLKQHWHRFRISALPVIAFFVCVAAMLWLWERQAHQGSVVGEVEANAVDVAAGIAGTLITPDGNYWELFDSVQQGQVLAMLDDTALQAELKTINLEAEALQAQLNASRTELILDELNLKQEDARERLRLSWELARRRLNRLQIATELRSDYASYQGVQATLDIFEELRSDEFQAVSETRLIELRQQRDALEASIRGNKRVYEEADQQVQQAVDRLEQFQALELPEAETVMAPIRAAIRVQESEMERLQLQIESLIIKSPMDGVITAIYRWPGQRILEGDPIVAIASESAEYVVSYVREDQRIPLYQGMQVQLRLRQPNAPEYRSKVTQVGPQVTQVPPHQLNDQATLEWATPIKIPIPSDLKQQDLRPGQLIQVIFNRSDISAR